MRVGPAFPEIITSFNIVQLNSHIGLWCWKKAFIRKEQCQDVMSTAQNMLKHFNMTDCKKKVHACFLSMMQISFVGNKISQTVSKGFDLLQANRITQNESKQSTSAKRWHTERYQRRTYNTSRQHKQDYSLNNTDLKVYVSSGWKKTIWNIFYKNPPRLDSSLLFICDSVPLWIIHNDKMQMRRSSTVFKVSR